MEFSKEQLNIINSPANEDILVNAGAGSGKTTVLTEKIVRHLTDFSNHPIAPSQLLVLTFTNNAAHEMKTRIIKAVNEFKCKNKEDEIKLNNIKTAINSSHIQTFDSFAQEIVKEFGYLIGVPNNITIANDFVLTAKIHEIVKEIFDELYANNNLEFIEFIKKYNLRDDKKTMQVIIDFSTKMFKLPKSQREDFTTKILEKFDNDNFFNHCWDQYGTLYYAKLVDDIKKDKNKTPEAKAVALSKTDELWKKVEEERGDKGAEKKAYKSTKKGFESLYSIYLKVQERLDSYKAQSSLYTFGDIADFAHQLLTNDSFKSNVRDVVRNRFKYLLVDEYQDTNDLQEDVINSLTQDYHDDNQIHLFCVGDKKQSIYGFRNARVQIFENRIKKLGADNVLDLKDNYRSFKEMLDANNEIFSIYMTPDHGDVDYSQPNQQLVLPENHQSWIKNDSINSKWGLHVLTCKDKQLLIDSSADDIKEWECKAVIKNILEKKNNHFQVYDDNINDYRDCDWNDFFILVRTKSNYNMYESEFAKANIPLNNRIATNLVEINAIMLINSFIKILDIIERNDTSPKAKEIKKHCFASIARSYIYGNQTKYSDQYIYDLLIDKNEKYLTDELFVKINNFYISNKNKPFSQIFINLLNEFNIMSKLYSIGENEKNIAKIESLYSLIISIEKAGGTIKDFTSLLEIVSKHNIEITDDSIVDMEKAVSLMTIHQAKGLQRKIVYLPNSVNHLGSGSTINKPDYDMNKEFGILLPIYELDRNIYSIPYRLFRLMKRSKLDLDEHVRLFYVALTRAEQLTYIVGYPKCQEKSFKLNEDNDETLFEMLSYVWKQKTLDLDNCNSLFPINNWEQIDSVDIEINTASSLKLNNIDNETINIQPRQTNKASQLKKNIHDSTIRDQAISEGNELHAIMERIDFNNPQDLSFIKKPEYKIIVNKILNDKLFTETLKGAKFHSEYNYYDKELKSNGYIDLLAIKNDIYYIIDWKLNKIDKPEYEKQMHIYQENIQRIFGIDKSKIKLILVSFEKQNVNEIKN